MQVRFIGDPAERRAGLPNSQASITVYGVTFHAGFGAQAPAVDISHLPEWQRQRIARHSHFEVVAEAEEAPSAQRAPGIKRGRKAQAEAEPVQAEGEGPQAAAEGEEA